MNPISHIRPWFSIACRMKSKAPTPCKGLIQDLNLSLVPDPKSVCLPTGEPSILPPRVSEPKPSQEALELSDPSDTTPVRFQEIFKDTLRKFSKAQGAQLGAL